MSLALAEIDAGQTLAVYLEATAGNLAPQVILRDFGGKALEAANLAGQAPQAALQYTMTENAIGYTLDVQAGWSRPWPWGRWSCCSSDPHGGVTAR